MMGGVFDPEAQANFPEPYVDPNQIPPKLKVKIMQNVIRY